MDTTIRPLGRLTRRILDLDYGDEQERLRYYETYAIAVHLQLIALPAVGAIVIGATGRPAIAPVVIMLCVAFSALLPGLIHLGRHNVQIESIATSKQNRGYMAAYTVSYLTLIVAVAARVSASDSGYSRGFTIGSVVGLGLGFAALALATRRQRTIDDTIEPES